MNEDAYIEHWKQG